MNFEIFDCLSYEGWKAEPALLGLDLAEHPLDIANARLDRGDNGIERQHRFGGVAATV